ncbi:hypothetical protein PCK2_000217, partial [Pneumocystis canis]
MHSKIERMRLWRHDALIQHQHETAAYIGDKILALTNDPNDAFWLAHVYYHTGHYARARGLLMNRYLLDVSVACRYLAALCLSKLSKWQEALELLESNPFRQEGATSVSGKTQDGGIKFEASMCYLRGVLYANLNKFDRAKECYKEALIIDIKCYEAFEQLIRCYIHYQSTHLPCLFLGMQHLQLNNLVLANEYFHTAYNLCKADPLLLNELGVVAFHKLQLPEAINLFRSALALAKEIDSEERAWIATWANLGHAYRKLRMYDDALRLSPRDPCIYAAIAMVHLNAHRAGDAVQCLHEALSLAPSDPIATDLLR